jgi:membrane associated rhomboid family serine protease
MIPLKDNIPNERFPLVTVVLVAINIVAYLLSIRHGGSLIGGPDNEVAVHYGAIPYELTHSPSHCDLVSGPEGAFSAVACQGQPGVTGTPAAQPATAETVLTSMFLHGGILHIAGNMVFLAIFGPNVEEAMGRFRFVFFYLLGGAIALAAQVLVDPNSTTPTLGASGAIAGVLGGYIVLYPHARILSLIFIVFFVTIIEVPAVFLLGFWFLEQVLFGAANATQPLGGGGGVAYFAHVGGFVFGLALIKVFAVHRRPAPPRYPVY